MAEAAVQANAQAYDEACNGLVVRIAMVHVVTQRQEQLHEQEHRDEPTAPGSEERAHRGECRHRYNGSAAWAGAATGRGGA